MNDSMSILLATTILALGGFGLYMYKTSDNGFDDDKEEKYNEDSIFGSSNFFNWSSSTDDKLDEKEDKQQDKKEDELEELDDEDFKPRKRVSKTQRNRKSMGSSKRRY